MSIITKNFTQVLFLCLICVAGLVTQIVAGGLSKKFFSTTLKNLHKESSGKVAKNLLNLIKGKQKGEKNQECPVCPEGFCLSIEKISLSYGRWLDEIETPEDKEIVENMACSRIIDKNIERLAKKKYLLREYCKESDERKFLLESLCHEIEQAKKSEK